MTGAELKNPVLAAVLGFALGPLGLLYVSVGHAVVAFGVIVVLSVITGGVLALPAWLGCAVVGYLSVNKTNATMTASASVASYSPVATTSSPSNAPPMAAPDSSKFCSECGQRLALTTRFCNKCGAVAA